MTDRLDHRLSHEWHVAINRFHQDKHGTDQWQRFMYEAKSAADEVPRLVKLFQMERLGKLPTVLRPCSCCPPQDVPSNHLTCCLGKKCSDCPMLNALESPNLSADQIDFAKAWTCAVHIISEGGDTAGEGYILTVDDRMYWDGVYQSLATPDDEDALPSS